jgi:hypothetical protein
MAEPSPMRSFDPRKVGTLECDAWVAYYRREWLKFLRAAIGLTRHTFGLPWPQTLYGAWLVLRANQLWAPKDNDPDGARRQMRRFYALVARHHGEKIDVDEAARLEVEWWRVHREVQHAPDGEADIEPLVDALARLYAHVYGVPQPDTTQAARERALAMVDSDRWVAQGCDPASPLVISERRALVRSYAALLAAVHR